NTLKITIIGCGIVGACLAYELSALPEVEVTVVEDRSRPGEGASGAALGICMGVISHKTKGRNWRLRQESLKRYDDLIAELEAEEGEPIPYNRQGIIKLAGVEESWQGWEWLQSKRQHQGYALELWGLPQVQAAFPALNYSTLRGAIYSPQDRQVHPRKLVQKLVQVGQRRGVQFCFNAPVQRLIHRKISGQERVTTVVLENQALETDYVILTAGVGNNAVIGSIAAGEASPEPDFQPVLGQAWQVLLPESLWAGPTSERGLHPVLTVRDLHFVPLGPTPQYWVGATVEFSGEGESGDPLPSETIAKELWQQAIEICPPLGEATIQQQWWGLRPRPLNQAAPVLQWSQRLDNLLWATGHYRNGIFLAPATALWAKEQILNKL
ncbi:MAG: NAD(P)/FAD-dependent oxidoreductase, partial [Prochlorothrix sp.]